MYVCVVVEREERHKPGYLVVTILFHFGEHCEKVKCVTRRWNVLFNVLASIFRLRKELAVNCRMVWESKWHRNVLESSK